MNTILRLPRLGDVDNRIWLMLVFLLIVIVQQIAGSFTGQTEYRIGHQTALMLVGVLAYLEIQRNSDLRLLARTLFYGVLLALIYKAAVLIPGVFNREPREWDFLVFYLDAKVAAAGSNLYDPASFIQVASEMRLQVSDEFRREIIGTGFKYPPVTALLLFPLSFGDIEQSNRIWLLFAATMVGLLCILMSRLLIEHHSNRSTILAISDSLVLAMIIVLAVPFRGLGVRHGQTTALLSCLAVLTMLFAGRSMSGVAACLAVVVKPFAAIPALLLLTARRWFGVIAGIVTALIVFVASVAILGTDDWMSYLQLEFATDTPAEPYYEPGNLSLLAVLARYFGYTGIPWADSHILMWYGSLGTIIAISTLWLSAKISRMDFRTAYCLLLVMALIVYPGTLYTYSIIASVPIAVEFWNQYRAKEHIVITVSFLAAGGLLLEWNLFAANIFVWAFLIRRALILGRSVGNGMPETIRAA